MKKGRNHMADLLPLKARSKSKYPWGKLVVGETFFVEGVPAHHMSSVARRQWLRYGDRYTCRTADSGCYVTRTA